MPRGEKLLSSEEDSEGSQGPRRIWAEQPVTRGVSLRAEMKRCAKWWTAPCNSPMHSGVPSQDCLMAQTEQEEASNPEESGKISLGDLKTEIFAFIKGAFQQEKAVMREEMLTLYRSQTDFCPPSPSLSSISTSKDSIRENKRAGSAWQIKAAPKKPKLIPVPTVDSSDSETQGKEEGELLSDQEDLEEMQVTEQSSRLFKIEDYHYLLSKSVAALHLGEAKSSEGSSKRKSTSLHKGDGEFFPPHPDSKRVFPFPEYFETQVTNQWNKPAANKRCPNYLRKLYDLPAYANNILQVPIIDGPVAAL
uniref:Uncharacterized protein n=1 Tax=Sphaerodactylus townsendi TaxID=933632 RepID=A0ACB8EPT4_9SAUR